MCSEFQSNIGHVACTENLHTADERNGWKHHISSNARYHFAHICKEKNDGARDLLVVHTCLVRYVVASFSAAILLRI